MKKKTNAEDSTDRRRLRTHGLVAGADGRRVVQDEDFAFKLPAGRRVQQRRHHHHPFADLRPFDLHDMVFCFSFKKPFSSTHTRYGTHLF